MKRQEHRAISHIDDRSHPATAPAANKKAPEGGNNTTCPHSEAYKPLNRENTVPEVGLEPHSSPCKHWARAETCGIRPSPESVRPNPKAKVCTLCTPLFPTF